MQPYLFPYVGYFQLVAAVDHFVFYDDVQYIQQGWINRNQTAAGRFTVPLARDAYTASIRERRIHRPVYASFVRKWLRGFDFAYRSAPHYAAVRELCAHVWHPAPDSIAELAARSVVRVSDYLGLNVQFHHASQLDYDRTRSGADRLLALLDGFGSGTYLNMIGGRDLYTQEAFARRGWTLRFLHPTLPPPPPDYGLSVLHALAHTSPEALLDVLKNYELHVPTP